jgi:hypothetical protein
VGGVGGLLFVVGRGHLRGCHISPGSHLCHLGGVGVCSGYQKV